jgi:hypothetical protein
MGRIRPSVRGYRNHVYHRPDEPGEPIRVTEFWRDGRGPELRRVLWDAGGTEIRAIEYLNPD